MIAHNHSTTEATGTHGKASSAFPVPPVVRDRIAEGAAQALRSAAPSLKAIMGAGAGSTSTAGRWQTTGEGSPVLAHDLVLYALAKRPNANPGVLVAHARITLTRSLMSMDATDLVDRYWKGRGVEITAAAAFRQAIEGRSVDMREVSAAARDYAGTLEMLAAIAEELDARRINPHAEGGA